MTAYVLVTAPASEPVLVATAKAHLRVDITTDDGLITGLITGAREQVENDTGKALLTQTWDLFLDCFPAGEIELAHPPLQSVTHIKYLDGAGVLQTLATSAYVVDAASERGRITPAYGLVWPVTYAQINAVTVRFVAGWTSEITVPQSIKHLLLLWVSHFYEQREPVNVGNVVNALPFSIESLTWANRSYKVV